MDEESFKREVLSNIYREVERYFAGVDDLAHGWEHVSRVYTLALHIAEREGANSFIVGLAALMHDLGRTAPANTTTHHATMAEASAATTIQRTAPTNTTTHHAILSATLARELLAPYGIPALIEEEILHAIVAHSFSGNIEPRTLEARVVRDADRLDGLGAIGIARWAVTGTIRRTAQTRTYHPTDPFAEQHILDEQQYMLDHFFSKLLKLSDSMCTETGRALAKRRTAFMYAYLDELRAELG